MLEGAVAALESNVSVNQDDIAILQGNVVSIEAELANIADTDAQTLTYDGATANLSISNGNNVVLQEVLDNASNISSAQTDIINLVSNQNSIAINVSKGIFYRVTHTCLSRQINYFLWFMIFKYCIQIMFITNIYSTVLII